MNKIRIGTRGSKLALRQAALVQEAMERACGDIVTELVILRTRGDRIQDRPLSALGDKGVFASELERALLAGQIDLAVHSAKDLPMKLADGLTTAAVLPRADARDVLVAPKGGRVPVLRQNLYGERELVSVEDTEKKDRTGSRAWREVCRGCEGRLAEESTARAMSGDGGHIFRLGTGSRRRQLLAGKIWENVICEEIRGNVDTRLRKLQEGRYDGIILAKAGLDRLGIGSDGEEAFDFYPLSPEVFLPAACQGILAVEAVEGSAAAGICKEISDAETELCYFVEREALAQLSADCSEAAAAWCRLGKYGHNCGGDPYVFGRGGEEFIALRDAGVRCEVIPGITSAIAVPAAAGIQTLARLKGTLVILMGMHHLAKIVVGLLAAGKDRLTPSAIVMDGTTERQRVVRAPLFELVARAAERGLTAPAVIVVGAVAKLELIMEGEGKAEVERETFIQMPLAGITVGVTGTAHFAHRLFDVLREKGAQPWDMHFMEIKPAREPLPAFADYGWLVFTSPNGVQVFLDKMRRERRDLRTLADKKIAVIGPGTALALQEAGIYEDYMPQVYDAAHLAGGLAHILMTEQVENRKDGREECRDVEDENLNGQQGFNGVASMDAGGKSLRTGEARCGVLLLRAKQGSDVLPRIFRERGIPYEEYALYELGVQEQRRDTVITKEPDYIVFGSAMGARAYVEGMEKKGIRNTRSRYVCIGEQCAKEVRKYVTEPPLVAAEADVEAIADCLCREGRQD